MLPFLNYMLRMFGTLCHEIGHTIAGFAVGRPCLPAFDFTYGGGVTTIGERSWWLIAAYGLAAVVLWRQAGSHRWIRRAIVLVATVLLLLVGTGLESAWFSWMGYGGQLLFATVFLHRALTGVAVIQPGERWLYGVVGWALLGHALALCWMLLFDSSFQQFYLIGKRGIDNDFVNLANVEFHVELSTVAWCSMMIGLLVPVVAFLAARRWPHGIDLNDGVSRQPNGR